MANAASMVDNVTEVGAMESSNTSGRPWPKGFPKVTTLADYKAFKSHPDYEAAKCGDINAAQRLVQGLLLERVDNRITAMAEKYPDAILLGIHAVEAAGKNEIPQALAEFIGGKTGLEVDKSIVQTNIVGHTGAGQNVRLYNRPKFEVERFSYGEWNIWRKL